MLCVCVRFFVVVLLIFGGRDELDWTSSIMGVNALARDNGRNNGSENKMPFRQHSPHKLSEQQSGDDSRTQVNLTYVK